MQCTYKCISNSGDLRTKLKDRNYSAALSSQLEDNNIIFCVSIVPINPSTELNLWGKAITITDHCGAQFFARKTHEQGAGTISAGRSF